MMRRWHVVVLVRNLGRRFVGTWFLISLALLLLAGCDRGPSSRRAAKEIGEAGPLTLRVAAAANLKFAFQQLATRFEQLHPEIELSVTYGASGSLYAQILQRAPFDIFFSADIKHPRRLVAEGRAEPSDLFTYARGRLVLWVPKDSPLSAEEFQLGDLAKPSVRKIAIANPRLAPYGAAATEALRGAGVWPQVEQRLVFGESVTQAAHYAASGAADAALIPLSLALSPELSDLGRYHEVPRDLYPPIEQAAVIVADSSRASAAEALRRFVVGPDGAQLLEQSGYLVEEP